MSLLENATFWIVVNVFLLSATSWACFDMWVNLGRKARYLVLGALFGALSGFLCFSLFDARLLHVVLGA